MDLRRLVFTVSVLLNLFIFPANASSRAQYLKTIHVSLQTEYGVFLGEIHFSEKDLVIAQKVERIIKEDLIKVINYFQYVPKDIVHFNVDPFMRLTNGNARIFPTNVINLYNFPAGNLEHLIVLENWMQGLVVHEFIHITHLDQTRDFYQNARHIFGTIAKVPPGIVPRWFTEGVATWGESHLINGGRLHNELLNKELFIFFKKADSCKSIDCLDDPGTYPNGELAYWAGAHFLEYLEKLRPETIRCLVERNSYAIPFFLNNAFMNCTGEKAQDLFHQFREDYLKSYATGNEEDARWGEKISNAFGMDDFQKGMVFDGDRLFKVEHERKSEALVAYDLLDQVNTYNKYEFPISDLAGLVLEGSEKFLLVSFNDEPNFRKRNKHWKLINADTLLIERSLNFNHDPTYVLPLAGGGFITFSYWNNQWLIERNGKTIKTLPANYNVVLARVLGDKLLFKVNDSYGFSELLLSDLDLTETKLLYKSPALFEIPLIAEDMLVIREEGNLKLLDLKGEGSLSSLPSSALKNVSFLSFNETRALALEQRLKSKPTDKAEFLKELTKEKSDTKTLPAEQFSFETRDYSTLAMESFPRLDHYIPHYWFLAFGGSENLGSIGAQTTFSDPMDVHFANASVLLYPDVRRAGGNFDYVHRFMEVDDQWRARAFFNQEYSKTNFSDHLNSDREVSVRTYYNVLLERWTYTPGIYAGYTHESDFISDRSVKEMGLSQALTYQAMSFDDFFQSFSASVNLQNNKANVGDNYFVTQILADFDGRFSERLMVGLKGSYGRLYKSDFARGVIYGGGINSGLIRRVHEFYGLPYSNAYGNEIFTARFNLDYNMWYIYRGKDLWPLFFREAHLILGRESLYADRIILDGQILREKMINSFFVGPRFKMILGYLLPVNVDLIFSHTINPDGKSVNSANFNIVADFVY